METELKEYTIKDFNIDDTSSASLSLVSDDKKYKIEMSVKFGGDLFFEVYRFNTIKNTWVEYDDFKYDITDKKGQNFYYCDDNSLSRAIEYLNASNAYEQQWTIKFKDMIPNIVREKDILFVTKCGDYGIFQRFNDNVISYTPVEIQKNGNTKKYNTLSHNKIMNIDEALVFISEEIRKKRF